MRGAYNKHCGERDLSPREVQVLRLIGASMSNKEIAFELGLSYGTVRVYINRLFHTLERKLPARNRTAAALYYHEHIAEFTP